MSALADRPDDNNNEDNLSSFSTQNDSSLPIEKQFTHLVFCQQIQNIDLDAAKQLLTELHMLYLGQQYVMVKLAKQDFLDGIK